MSTGTASPAKHVLSAGVIEGVCQRVEKFLDMDGVECRIMRATVNDPEACPMVHLQVALQANPHRDVDLADLLCVQTEGPRWLISHKATDPVTLDIKLMEDSVLLQGIQVHTKEDTRIEEWLQSFLGALAYTFSVLHAHEFYGSTDDPHCMVDSPADPTILAGGMKIE